MPIISEEYRHYPTKSGWYCIVMLDDGNEPDFGPIYYFDAETCVWVNEDNDEVDSVYDPFLGCEVSIDGADGYVPQ